MLIHPYSSLKLYQIHRLGLAIRHVLGPDVRVKTSTGIDGAMFLHWLAWLTDDQVAALLEIDWVSASRSRRHHWADSFGQIEEIHENVEWPGDNDVGTSR